MQGAQRRLKCITWWQSWSISNWRNKSKDGIAYLFVFSYICAGGRDICLGLKLTCLSKKSHSLGFMFSVFRTLEFNIEVISNFTGEDESPFRSPWLDIKNLNEAFPQMTDWYHFLSLASSGLLHSVRIDFLCFLRNVLVNNKLRKRLRQCRWWRPTQAHWHSLEQEGFHIWQAYR